MDEPGKKYKILIVDDDKDMCASLADVLSLEKSYKPFYTPKPKKAVDMVRKRVYDLVIVDYKMPEMDGIETLKAIKAIRPKIPVIMLTAFISVQLVEKAKNEGAIEVLSKFIWPDELLEHTENALSTHTEDSE